MVLYATEKGGQRATQRRERETECCCERAMAWAINLTVGTNIFDSQRKDNPRSYKDEHLDCLQEFRRL